MDDKGVPFGRVPLALVPVKAHNEIFVPGRADHSKCRPGVVAGPRPSPAHRRTYGRNCLFHVIIGLRLMQLRLIKYWESRVFWASLRHPPMRAGEVGVAHMFHVLSAEA